jgi:hypothetical protein
MNDCGAKSKLSAPLIYLSKTGNYSYLYITKHMASCVERAPWIQKRGKSPRGSE